MVEGASSRITYGNLSERQIVGMRKVSCKRAYEKGEAFVLETVTVGCIKEGQRPPCVIIKQQEVRTEVFLSWHITSKEIWLEKGL